MKPEQRRQMMILSGGLLLFQLFLLYYAAPAGQPLVQVLLCAGFSAADLWLCWKKPLLGRLQGWGRFFYFLCLILMILTTNGIEHFASTLGALALAPVNLVLLAVCLLAPAVNPKAWGKSD